VQCKQHEHHLIPIFFFLSAIVILFLDAILIFLHDELAVLVGWAIFLVTLPCVVIVLLIVIIYRQPQNIKDLKFKVSVQFLKFI
jgi:glycerol-3-phosphate acyltransferase PlsY